MITQIDASEAILTLTFCDSVQYLRSIGADYVRNFYGGDSEWKGVKTVWVNNEARTPHKQGVILHGGEYKDIIIDKNSSITYSDQDAPINWHDTFYATIPTPHFKKVKHIKITGIQNMGLLEENNDFDVDLKIYANDSAGKIIWEGHQHITIGTFGWGEFNIELNPPIEAEGDSIFLHTSNPNDVEGNWHYKRGVEGARVAWDGGGIEDGACLDVELTLTSDTSDVEGTNYDRYFKIKSIDGTTVTEDMIKSIDWDPNTQIFYTDPSAWIFSGKIFQQILKAYDFVSDILPDNIQVSVFRCNGDIIHNYLLALADMETDGKGERGKRQFGFRANATDWNRIDNGYRSKKSDESVLDIFYAKDIINKRDAFISFNPSISLKNNPRLTSRREPPKTETR